VIRNVVVGRLHPGVALEAIRPGLDAVLALDPHGLVSCRLGTDLGLRDGSWDYAITSDFVDEAAYRAYDEDAEHNRIRRELIAPLSAQIARVQFSV
jgi:hypothetical protein